MCISIIKLHFRDLNCTIYLANLLNFSSINKKKRFIIINIIIKLNNNVLIVVSKTVREINNRVCEHITLLVVSRYD